MKYPLNDFINHDKIKNDLINKNETKNNNINKNKTNKELINKNEKKNSPINQNKDKSIIIGEIYINKNNINKDIRIINSFENMKKSIIGKIKMMITNMRMKRK